MNVINEMVSDLNKRKSKIEVEETSKTQNKLEATSVLDEVGLDTPKSNGKRVISWQASSSIVLLTGVSLLSYAIWSYNSQPQTEEMVKVAEFVKPEMAKEDTKAEKIRPLEETNLVTQSQKQPTTSPTRSTHGKNTIPESKKKLIAKNDIPVKKEVSKTITQKPVPKIAKTEKQTIQKKSPLKAVEKKEQIVAKATHEPSLSKKAEQIFEKRRKEKLAKKAQQAFEKKRKLALAKKAEKLLEKRRKDRLEKEKATELLAKKEAANEAAREAEKAAAKELAAKQLAAKEIEKANFKKQAIKFSNSQSAKKHYSSALAQLNAGDTEAAKKSLNKTLSFKANHIAARKTLAGMYINENKLSKAKQTLNEGIKQSPEASVFYHLLARIHMEQRQFKKASELLLSGSKHAKDGEYFALMALAQQNTPGFKNAIASYRQALSYKPTESKWWLGLGIVLEKTNNWNEAKDAYTASLKPENLPFFLHNQANERLIFVNNQIALLQDN